MYCSPTVACGGLWLGWVQCNCHTVIIPLTIIVSLASFDIVIVVM